MIPLDVRLDVRCSTKLLLADATHDTEPSFMQRLRPLSASPTTESPCSKTKVNTSIALRAPFVDLPSASVYHWNQTPR